MLAWGHFPTQDTQNTVCTVSDVAESMPTSVSRHCVQACRHQKHLQNYLAFALNTDVKDLVPSFCAFNSNNYLDTVCCSRNTYLAKRKESKSILTHMYLSIHNNTSMLDFQRPDNRFVQIHGLTLTILLQDVIAHINLQSRNYENECYLNVNLFLTLYSFRSLGISLYLQLYFSISFLEMRNTYIQQHCIVSNLEHFSSKLEYVHTEYTGLQILQSYLYAREYTYGIYWLVVP